MIKTLLLALLPVAYTVGQNRPYHQFGLGTGLSIAAVRNEGISQLIQRGAGFPGQLHFLRQGNLNRHYVQGQLATYSEGLSSTYGASATELTTGHLQYAYHRRTRQFGQWTGWAGAVANLQFMYVVFTANAGGNRFANKQSPWLLSSLNASALVSRPVGRGRVEGQAWVNLLGYNIRPGYTYDYPGVNDVKTWLAYGSVKTGLASPQLNARLSYDAFLSTHFRLRLDYQWQFWQVRQPRYSGMLTNQLVTSIAYQF